MKPVAPKLQRPRPPELESDNGQDKHIGGKNEGQVAFQ
jgi:hypothetical protein